MYNADGMLVGATLEILVERVTPHAHIVDPQFSTVFFSTFRMFTTPAQLVEALRSRYNLSPPPELGAEPEVWRSQTLTPIRLRVLNLLRTWLEFQWRPTDRPALEPLSKMIDEDVMPTLARAAARLVELVQTRQAARPLPGEIGLDGETGAAAGAGAAPVLLMGQAPSHAPLPPAAEAPRPIISKAVLALLKEGRYGNVSPLDFDVLELARQLTLMENELVRAVRPEELLGPDHSLGNVRRLSTLSTALTTWIVESVLAEVDTRRRTALVKFWVKVGDVSLVRARCLIIG
jgi:hypothetical protein